MTLEAVLYDHLANWPALMPLVGNRIYRIRAPQGVALPFMVHSRVSTIRTNAMQRSVGACTTRIQIDGFAASDDASRELARAITSSFDAWMAPSADPVIFGAFVENDQDQYDENADIYRCILDVAIDHMDDAV